MITKQISPKQRKLTPKQQEFSSVYIANGGNGKAAAMAMGYEEKHAAQAAHYLANRPNVAKVIEDKRRKVQAELDCGYAWKMKQLKIIAEMHFEKFPTASISAISEMNKMDGDYAPTKNVNINENINLQIEEQKFNDYLNKYKRDY